MTKIKVCKYETDGRAVIGQIKRQACAFDIYIVTHTAVTLPLFSEGLG